MGIGQISLTETMDLFTDRIEAYLNQNPAQDATVESIGYVTDPITAAAHQNADSPDKLRFDLFWDAFILVAKNQLTTDDTTKLNRLVSLIKSVKSLGYITVNGAPVKTDLGYPWTDLPYLGSQMREAWNQAPPTSSAEQWANLNGFVARLTHTDIHDFSLYAIWSLRDALETPRPLTERQTGEGDKQASKEEEVSTDELLPGALEWISNCADLLAKLVGQNKSFKPADRPGPDPGFLGQLAKDAGLTEGGFNAARWSFWRKRLEEISQTRDDAGGREKIAKLAYQGLQNMNQYVI